MCRLLAVRAEEPVPLYRLLVGGDNSFAVQSLEHPDGWGISYYLHGYAALLRSVVPSIIDRRFEEVSFSAQSTTALGHIRKATTGSIAEVNCHPFQHGRWTFAHNGQILGFDRARDRLFDTIPPGLRAGIRGQTDSELFFHIVLTELARGTLDVPEASSEQDAVGALGRAIARIRAITEDDLGGFPDEAQLLTCVLTNSATTVAVRWGKPLWFQSYCDEDTPRAVVIASERVGTSQGFGNRSPWVPVQAYHYLSIGPSLDVSTGTLAEAED